MKFEEALANATGETDVQGIPRQVGPIVRRKLPVEPINIAEPIKKKKKKRKKAEE